MARAAFQADQPITPCCTTRGLRELIWAAAIHAIRLFVHAVPSFQRSMTRSSLGSLQRNRDAPSRTPCPQREGRNVALSPATTMRTSPPPTHTQRSAPLLRAGRLAARNDTTQPITGTSSTFIPIFLLLVAPDAAETGQGRAAIAELITPRDATGFKQDYYAVKSHYVSPPPLLDCAAAKEGKAWRRNRTRRCGGRRHGRIAAAGTARRAARAATRAKGRTHALGKPRSKGRLRALGKGGGHPMAGAGHVRPFRSEIVRRARSDATR